MKRFCTFFVGMLTALSANAIELPEIIGDNMVLQQQSEAKLWGWAKPGNKIVASVSWNSESYSAVADNDGKWTVKVKTPGAGYDQQSLVIKEMDGKKTVDEKNIHGILIGEVWFCSGQSNMEMPLGGFWNCPVEGANEAIAKSINYKNKIRVATVPKVGKQEPADRVAGKWEISEPKNASRFSACGYFFATTLVDMLDVPVGIINCSWGGSCVEGWLPKDTLLTYPDGLTPMDDTDYHAKMVMFNGMLAPLAGYTIKGFLWNQGESNVGKEKEYITRFSTMTRLWRKMWNQPGDKLPMYTVEMPPYSYGDVNGTWGANFRAVQHQIAKQLENSGCVCTSDLIYPYEPEQVHGSQKQKIGQRLAYMALTRDYGLEGVESEAPEFEYMKEVDASKEDQAVIAGTAVKENPNAKGKIMQLYFSHSSDGFDRLSDIEGFEAQGTDGQWHKAIVWAGSAWQNVERQGCFLKLVCPEAGEIKNVRYCYHNFSIGQLHSVRGLPVVPFTTEK